MYTIYTYICIFYHVHYIHEYFRTFPRKTPHTYTILYHKTNRHIVNTEYRPSSTIPLSSQTLSLHQHVREYINPLLFRHSMYVKYTPAPQTQHPSPAFNIILPHFIFSDNKRINITSISIRMCSIYYMKWKCYQFSIKLFFKECFFKIN